MAIAQVEEIARRHAADTELPSEGRTLLDPLEERKDSSARSRRRAESTCPLSHSSLNQTQAASMAILWMGFKCESTRSRYSASQGGESGSAVALLPSAKGVELGLLEDCCHWNTRNGGLNVRHATFLSIHQNRHVHDLQAVLFAALDRADD